jgi:flagellar hook-basal body complex protein FliE
MKISHLITPGLPGAVTGQPVAPAGDAIKQSNVSFGATLRQAMKDVNALQTEAGTAIEKMVAGENIDIHEVMIAVEKAKTSFDLLMEIRNKAIESYREIVRMQI